MYDWAQASSDSIEGVTHSLCTLEYEDHRPLYDWYLDTLGIFHPQAERVRAAQPVPYGESSASSCRLVRAATWRLDDPRMPTSRACAAAAITAESIRDFCERIGVGQERTTWWSWPSSSTVSRETSTRRRGAAWPSFAPSSSSWRTIPRARSEEMDAVNNPEDPSAGTRRCRSAASSGSSRNDFREVAPKSTSGSPSARGSPALRLYRPVHRLQEKRRGRIVEVRCQYDPSTVGGDSKGRSVKGTIHWVSAPHATQAEVRLYDTPLRSGQAGRRGRFQDGPEPAVSERALRVSRGAGPGRGRSRRHRFNSKRTGYFCADTRDSAPGRLVFNRTVGLRDSWGQDRKSRRLATPRPDAADLTEIGAVGKPTRYPPPPWSKRWWARHVHTRSLN